MSLARIVMNLMISFETLFVTSPHFPLQSCHRLCQQSSPDPQLLCCCWMWCLEINQKIGRNALNLKYWSGEVIRA